MGNSSNKGKGPDFAEDKNAWKGDKIERSVNSKDVEETSQLPPLDIYSIEVRFDYSSLSVCISGKLLKACAVSGKPQSMSPAIFLDSHLNVHLV